VGEQDGRPQLDLLRRIARYSGLSPATAMNSRSPTLLTSAAAASPSRKTRSPARRFRPITRPRGLPDVVVGESRAPAVEHGPGEGEELDDLRRQRGRDPQVFQPGAHVFRTAPAAVGEHRD
jgi:hypothetical protein